MSSRFSRLPTKTKLMYEGQKKWMPKNYGDTLGKHKSEIEDLIQRINILSIWSTCLSSCSTACILIPEIFMDGYLSVHFACWGLYKYANVCLRAQLETTLRLIYFSTHPVEFKWWSVGNESYRQGLMSRDVWGEGYQYFEQLDTVKAFDKGQKIKLLSKVKLIYRKLSTYVHSGVSTLQTRQDSFSPRYKIKDYGGWRENFKEIQSYINTLLMLGFMTDFKILDQVNQDIILNSSITSVKDRVKIKELITS